MVTRLMKIDDASGMMLCGMMLSELMIVWFINYSFWYLAE